MDSRAKRLIMKTVWENTFIKISEEFRKVLWMGIEAPDTLSSGRN